MSSDVFPLLFQPLYRRKLWGGRNLKRRFDKPLPPDGPIGESWECADLPEGQSVVAVGPARGRTLAQMVAEWGPDLLGRVALHDGRFPLLIKFLDAVQPLSVQVHPDAQTAARLGGGARAKDEAWYVVEAGRDACVYLGLREGTTHEDVRAAVNAGRIVELMNRLPVRVGQSFHVPPGTLHAIGGDVVVAEVETPSDTTFRLFDWGRQRPAGDAGLHVEAGLSSIHLDAGRGPHGALSHRAGVFTTVSQLVKADAFMIEKVRFIEGMEMEIPYAEMVVWLILEGRGAILFGANASQPFKAGDCVVLPAALRGAKVKTEVDCVWLEITVPTRSDLAEFPRPDAAELRDPKSEGSGPIQLNLRLSNETRRD